MPAAAPPPPKSRARRPPQRRVGRRGVAGDRPQPLDLPARVDPGQGDFDLGGHPVLGPTHRHAAVHGHRGARRKDVHRLAAGVDDGRREGEAVERRQQVGRPPVGLEELGKGRPGGAFVEQPRTQGGVGDQQLDVLAGHSVEAQTRLVVVERAHHIGGTHHRVAAPQRHRGVTRFAADHHAKLRGALLTDVQLVEPPAAGHVQKLPAALVEQIVAAHQVGALRAQPARPADGAVLFVGLGHEDDLAGEVAALVGQACHHHAEGSQQVLHVDRAATPHVAIFDNTGEGRLGPVLGGRRHHVFVGHEHEAGTGTRAGKRGDEATPLGRLADDLALQAVPAEVVVKESGDRAFVAGRVARVYADQRAEQRGRLALDARHQFGVDAGDLHGRVPPVLPPIMNDSGDDERLHPRSSPAFERRSGAV